MPRWQISGFSKNIKLIPSGLISVSAHIVSQAGKNCVGVCSKLWVAVVGSPGLEQPELASCYKRRGDHTGLGRRSVDQDWVWIFLDLLARYRSAFSGVAAIPVKYNRLSPFFHMITSGCKYGENCLQFVDRSDGVISRPCHSGRFSECLQGAYHRKAVDLNESGADTGGFKIHLAYLLLNHLYICAISKPVSGIGAVESVAVGPPVHPSALYLCTN
jgi:hypothetical protein